MRFGALISSVALLTGLCLLTHSTANASASPGGQLDDFFQRALAVIGRASDAVQAQQEIRRLARPVFDVGGAARRVLGPDWSALSVAEREEFVRLFGDHVLWGYLTLVRNKLSRDRAPSIRVVDEQMGKGGQIALVRTLIRAKDGADARFDYVMTKTGTSWLVRDVLVDGVSLIENYRAQVAQVRRTSSYSGLLARLRTGATESAPAASPALNPPVRPAAPQSAEKP
jgi:ABC-type transporter MlaC component